eukprot:TRINITY_DN11595_c0_g1_i1.p1 TRINITY_DN11595_c0_g1~~TRINITY_DN11595_c0_g1_i1.p1  ORF type:complete len:219 (-),score=42.53 TRINITY_DN11595_c0_g1_i1:161-817(-)
MSDSLDWIPADVARYALVAVLGTAGALMVYRRYGRHLTTVDHFTPEMWSKRRRFRAIVTSVGDGDNFRCFHKPSIRFWERVPKVTAANTIGVRLAGVDAPECAHFGKEGQPFGEEAKLWLRNRLVGRVIVVEPYQRDQYNRVVGMVWVKGFWRWHNVSELLLNEGLGTVYIGGQAVYGGMEKIFERAEASAKTLRKGMWSQRSYKSPMEFKREQRNAD